MGRHVVPDTRRCIYKSPTSFPDTSPNGTACNKLHRTAGSVYGDGVALPHAILVSLSEQTGSGYELARRFDRSIGYFWAATHQQIYRTLRTMENDGWVHVDVVEQQARPDKKVYRVTDPGRAELTRWIAEPLQGRGSSVSDSRTRELAVKIRGVTHVDDVSLDALRTQVHELRRERAELLDTYLGLAKRQFPDPAALHGATLHQYLVLRGGIRAEESSIDWLDEVAAAMKGTP